MADPASRTSRAYMRFVVADRPGVLAEITAAMRDAGVSIESLMQQGRQEEGGDVLVAIVSHDGPESAVAAVFFDTADAAARFWTPVDAFQSIARAVR